MSTTTSTDSNAVIHPTAETFDAQVGGSEVPVLVDFWAPWCPPCVALKPVVQQLAGEVSGKAKVAFVNVDENPELAERFGVQSIPALFIVSKGRVVDAMVGFTPKDTLKARLAAHGGA
jgi:thioredoxin 1